MYVSTLNPHLPESNPGRKSRAFSSHKSARSWTRRGIREGADCAVIVFRPADAEGSEADALKNVYRADVDTALHTRRHVRVSVDDFRSLIAAQAKTAPKAQTKAK